MEGIVAHLEVQVGDVEARLVKVGRHGHVHDDIHDAEQRDQHQDELGQLSVEQSLQYRIGQVDLSIT